MKRKLLLLFGLFVLFSCSKESKTTSVETKQLTFSVQGDFTFAPMTRAALEADGKSMTDLWILDYFGTELVQTIHQVSSDTDFGTPTLNLQYGSHRLYENGAGKLAASAVG